MRTRRTIKNFSGVLLCCMAFVFMVSTEKIEQSIQPVFIFHTFLCITLAILLFRSARKDLKREKENIEIIRSYKNNPVPKTIPAYSEEITLELPEGFASAMRSAYTLMQAEGDARIMVESFQLINSTKSMETFTMRYNLCLRKAYTLLQAEQSKVKGIEKLNIHNACVMAIKSSHDIKIKFLHNYSQDQALKVAALKTSKGKLNRYLKMKQELIDAEATFMEMDEYDSLMKSVDRQIVSYGGEIIYFTEGNSE